MVEEARISILSEVEAEPFAAPPGADDSASPDRAALVAGSARQICLVRKLACGGAVLDLGGPVEPGRRFALELAGGLSLAGSIAWSLGREAGLAFDAPLDVLALVARDLANQPGDRRRLPRIELRVMANFESAGLVETGLVRDISQAGLKIESARRLEPGARAVVRLPGLAPIEGEVRWWDRSLAGIRFHAPLGWEALMPWLRGLQEEALQPQARSAPAVLPPPPPPPGPARAAGEVQLNIAASIRDGRRRWNIEVAALDAHSIRFECFGSPAVGTLLWLKLPGLEGWPCRVSAAGGGMLDCDFLQPLHPAVLDRILAAARR